MKTTFSMILRQYIEEKGLNLTEYCNQLNDLGIYVSYPSLYAYYTGKNVPSYEIARKILDYQKENLNEKEIIATLKYSRDIIKQENDNDDLLNVNLKIKPEQIDARYKNSSKYLKSAITMRAEELFGKDNLVTQFSKSGKGKLSAYVAYLIKEDLKNNGYFN